MENYLLLQSRNTRILKKILLIRFSSIGDIVLTTPVIRCVKTQLQGVELHVLTKKSYRSLYLNNPYVDKVFDFEASLNEVIPELKAEAYDHVIDLHKNIRSLSVRRALRCSATSFPKLNFKKFLLTQFKIDKMPNLHIVDRYFESVRDLGVVNDGKGLDFFFAEGDELHDVDLPEEFRKGYVAICIGGQHKTKILPKQQVVKVCEALDYPVILVGGSEDFVCGKSIAGTIGENIWNSCGELTIGQSASVLKMSDAVLTNDTGMMHIAAALHKPIVSVWGNTVPEFGMFPYLPTEPGKSKIMEVKDLKCRPCHKLGYKECPKGHFKCMMDQDPKAIAAAIRSFIDPEKLE